MPGVSKELLHASVSRTQGRTQQASVGKLDSVKKSVVDPIADLLSVYEVHPHEEQVDMSHLYSGKDFFDDVHGLSLIHI